MNQYEELLDKLIKLDCNKKRSLEQYYYDLIEQSKIKNLTTITKVDEVYIKHFYDSMLTLKNFSNVDGLSLLDIGSGAGFPGIVLKIVYPKLNVTLLEPTKKRCDFLNDIINKLALKSIEVVNDRAENYINEHRESFDFVVARAVASMNIICELSIPFVKVGGYFLALKGQNYLDECTNIDKIFTILSCKNEINSEYELPNNMGKRFVIHIKKIKETNPIYPRHYSKIKKNPL